MALGRHCTQWHWESTDIRLINDWHCPTPAYSHTCPVSHLILQSHNDSNVLDSIKMVENLEIRQHSQIRSFRWKCLLQTDEYGIEEWERDSPLVLNMYSIYIWSAEHDTLLCTVKKQFKQVLFQGLRKCPEGPWTEKRLCLCMEINCTDLSDMTFLGVYPQMNMSRTRLQNKIE